MVHANKVYAQSGPHVRMKSVLFGLSIFLSGLVSLTPATQKKIQWLIPFHTHLRYLFSISMNSQSADCVTLCTASGDTKYMCQSKIKINTNYPIPSFWNMFFFVHFGTMLVLTPHRPAPLNIDFYWKRMTSKSPPRPGTNEKYIYLIYIISLCEFICFRLIIISEFFFFWQINIYVPNSNPIERRQKQIIFIITLLSVQFCAAEVKSYLQWKCFRDANSLLIKYLRVGHLTFTPIFVNRLNGDQAIIWNKIQFCL